MMTMTFKCVHKTEIVGSMFNVSGLNFVIDLQRIINFHSSTLSGYIVMYELHEIISNNNFPITFRIEIE